MKTDESFPRREGKICKIDSNGPEHLPQKHRRRGAQQPPNQLASFRRSRLLAEEFWSRSRVATPLKCWFCQSGQVRPRQGTESCNFGAPTPLEALHWIFCFFSRFSVQFSKTSPLKSGESSKKSNGENRIKSCHVCGCHGFFGPEPRKQRTRKAIRISRKGSPSCALHNARTSIVIESHLASLEVIPAHATLE